MTTFKDILADYKVRHRYQRLQPLAALIDMDGTLYDSMGNHAEAWRIMCEENGLAVSRDEFFLYEGMTGAQTIDLIMQRCRGRHATPEECVQLYHRKTEIFKQLPEVSPMPGAQALTDLMKEVGMRRVLVTGSGQNSLLNRLEIDYPGVFLDGMRVTSRDVTHGKPHPEPYIRGMQLAQVTPSQAIAIENAPLGVKSAATAGALTIGVVTGPVPRAELEGAGAAIVFDSMPECAEAFPQLLYEMLTL
ncbi:MAG: HAD hydrolase-like protein [Muribaculaceae bacterium]|nr:HAD hydrolase-like protein [Muribaculaceae bacterium]